MTTPRRLSARGLAFVKRWEGFRAEAYRDIAGVATIGYGHTESFRDGRLAMGARIDEGEARALLREDLGARERRVRALVRPPLNQNEFDALVSFEFNTGGLARSTALARLNRGDRLGAAEALTWWSKARINGALQRVDGLARRRVAEAALFLEPVSPCGPRRPRRSQASSGRKSSATPLLQ